MITVKVRIEGIAPLLLHKFSGDDLVQPKSKKKNQKKNMDDVESYLYLDENKQLVHPATHLIGAMKIAGAKFQIPGQGKLTYKNLVGSGSIIIAPDMIPHECQDWEVDRRSVVIQRSRIVRERPVLNKWSLSFNMEIDDDEIPFEVANEILEYAGRRVGIGDFRPGKGGPYGKFIITKFEN